LVTDDTLVSGVGDVRKRRGEVREGGDGVEGERERVEVEKAPPGGR